MECRSSIASNKQTGGMKMHSTKDKIIEPRQTNTFIMAKSIVTVPLLLALVAIVLGQLEAIQDGKEFPSLWSSVQSGESKSYHVLYQLEMEHSNDLLMLEEWADYDERLHRLDLITSSKARTSYLFNGQSHEVFRYRPYTCERLAADSPDFDVLSKLFIGYSWSRQAAGANASESSFKEAVLAFGLGPLWLRASEDSISAKLFKADSGLRNQFKEYEVVMKQNLVKDQLPYMMRFYFPKGAQHFVDSIEWDLETGGEDEEQNKIVRLAARLKVIQLDYEAPDQRVFQLPLGYGCQRRLELDHELQIDLGLVLLHAGVPNQVALDVTFSQPEDELLHSWTSHRYAMRMLRFSRPRQDHPAKTESVYVSLIQSRSLEDGGKLTRTKRVWWDPDSSDGLASVYEIDQRTGDCKMTHRDVRDQIILGLFPSEFISTTRELKPMVLSVDQISFLLADNTGYHLIDGGQPLGPNEFRERLYEKRVDNFKLTTDSSLVWSGPVSIVKRISSLSQINKAQSKLTGRSTPSLLRDYRTTLTILFYSEHYDQLLYKIVIELLGNHEVNYAYAHQQMDISACTETVVSEETGELVPTPSGGKQMVSVKYELKDQREAAKLKENQDLILSALFVNMFEQPTTFLSPLQISDLQLSFDLFTMRLQMSILDLPLTQLFRLELGHKLAPIDNSSYESCQALLETTSSSAELCSQRCDHYNCLRFSYEPSKKGCQIELVPGGVGQVDCEGCQLYSFFDRRRRPAKSAHEPERQLDAEERPVRPHLSAAALVEYFEQLIEASDRSLVNVPNPLELNVNVASLSSSAEDVIELRPSSLRHELETMNEYAREMDEENERRESGAAGLKPQFVRQLAGRKLKLEFVLLLDDARMIGPAIEEVASYEQCEKLCEMEDCRSFVYCGQEFTCKLSYVHDEKFIKKVARRVEPRLHCNIYSLDYLSKFEPYGRALEPIEVRDSFEATTPRVCANNCMDKQDYACQGFFHCRLPAASNKGLASDANFCYLIDKHLSQVGGEQRERIFGSPNSLGLLERRTSQPAKKICSFWSRSYVAQFDKYFGKRIELTQEDTSAIGRSMMISTANDVDADYCARRCVELNCLGFDLCPAKRGKQACTLVFASLRSSQLKPAPECTTFVVSDKSHFKANKIKLLHDDDNEDTSPLKPDREAQVAEAANSTQIVLDEQLEQVLESDRVMSILRRFYEHESVRLANHFAESGHWLSRLVSFTLGISTGCLLIVAWNEAYARGWLDQVRQQVTTDYGLRLV